MKKTKENLRIVFMGTPDFAVASLSALLEGGYNVVGVVTMPDKPAGRGYKMQQSAVKQFAVEHNLYTLQPERLKEESFLSELKSLNADLQIVVAFRMLPQEVWDMPPLGTFNLHGSLLPQYRGAAPINRAIMNGEKETGVTTFFLTHEIDTGKVIFRERTPISEDDNAETVHDRLMAIGASLVTRTVDAVLDDTFMAIDQKEMYSDEKELKSAPKIFKKDCRIDWSLSVDSIFNFVRGLSPYPASWTELYDSSEKPTAVKLFAVSKRLSKHNDKPGSIITDGKTILEVAVEDGYISVLELQLAGKRRVKVDEFLRGYKINNDICFK